MRKFTILLVAIFTILSDSLYAQDTTTISAKNQNHLTKSKKELMKLEIMKIDPTPIPTNISLIGSSKKAAYFTSMERSKKEQMKMTIMKIDEAALSPKPQIHTSAKCAACLLYLNRSKKEQMKMELMKIQACSHR